jgi:hypothetical protein
MDEDEVPQDASPTYGGQRKLLYAVDRAGSYVGVRSSGWNVESEATGAALEEIERARQDAWARARDGRTSPLEYYMHLRRMDLALLSQTTGFSRWRIRRHFRPDVHARLSPRVLARYAEALGIDADTLKRLVERP